jgi:ADP-ribose pyrophosphatase
VGPNGPLSPKAKFFQPENIPFDKLSRPDVANILRRYLDEKNTGQFGIYVGDEHQGHIEQIAEREI